MDAGTLHGAIAEVCPVVSTRVGDPVDRGTWSFVSGEGATQEQIDAGNHVIATIPADYKPPPEVQAESAAIYDHENRLRSLEGQPPLSVAEFLASMKAGARRRNL